jgi:hypothetical protein
MLNDAVATERQTRRTHLDRRMEAAPSWEQFLSPLSTSFPIFVVLLPPIERHGGAKQTWELTLRRVEG